MLMKSQFWPPERMLEFQRSQLSQLLRHAKATVPFYKTRLDAVFTRNGEIDWDRWHEIPIVTRADLRDSDEEMCATTMPPGHGKYSRNFTSGSTGIPISFRRSGVLIEASNAAYWRFDKWVELDWSRNCGDFPPHFTHERANQEGFYTGARGPSWLQDFHGTSIALNREDGETNTLSLLRRFAVQSISSSPNHVESLAHENLAAVEPVTLEKIVCYGMHTLDHQKVLFKQSFGAETYCIYGAEEVGLIAAQCKMKEAYHINAELMLVEIVDDQGQPSPKGIPGRVVLTPFYSSAQPLVRYDIGDIANLDTPCSCGKNLPTISAIVGRHDPIFKKPDGKGFWPVFDHEAISANLQCRSYQIAQIDQCVFEVRYIPRSRSQSRDLEIVRKHVEQALYPTVTINIKEMNRIPLGGGMKLQRLVREIQ